MPRLPSLLPSARSTIDGPWRLQSFFYFFTNLSIIIYFTLYCFGIGMKEFIFFSFMRIINITYSSSHICLLCSPKLLFNTHECSNERTLQLVVQTAQILFPSIENKMPSSNSENQLNSALTKVYLDKETALMLWPFPKVLYYIYYVT